VTTTWKIVLDAPAATCARVIVDAIVNDLASGRTPEDTSQNAQADPFIALLFAEAAGSLAAPMMTAKAEAVLETAVSGLAERPMEPGLFGGFCGVAWLAMRLPGMLKAARRAPKASHTAVDEVEAQEDPCEEIDQALIGRLRAPIPYHDCDLISGLVGVGVYALERLSRPSGRELLELVVKQLARNSVERHPGITWHTHPALLPEQQRREAPAGYYNLGVAHGVPGTVAFLGYVVRTGIAEDEASRLLHGAVAWLLSQQLDEGEGARYPSRSGPGVKPIAGRMAWCYGGLGVSAALMVAARAVGDERWEREAVRLALMEAGRAEERAGVKDACLCHGSAGNAHVFRRLYQATGVGEFLTAARFWYGKTLAMWTPRTGIGGYHFWGLRDRGNLSSPSAWIVDPSFLSGSAGVGLALISATTAAEPTWDRLLLCDTLACE
jgi:lantibiotic biosynthesis protein